MSNKQKLAVSLLVLGLFFSASPLFVTLATQGLIAPECLEREVVSQECIKYGGDLLWVMFSSFVSVGQKYIFFVIPIGVVLIVSAFILSFIEAPKANTYDQFGHNR